ncbi:MAG: protein-tyrosine-phosphatase [Saprospiraceae bacterium]|nr:protein-tyrosine-phosphatase [Saprospiraceae bacterium]
MFQHLKEQVQLFSADQVSGDRRVVLQPLIDFIQSQRDAGEIIRLNFICTHNSRRSHLSQIWAQAMAHAFGIRGVQCYSGGTEATAMFPKVVETLRGQGFAIQVLGGVENPVYAVKYAENEPPVVCFSKTYDDPFNPKGDFAAIMTCDSADENCPVVFGARRRIPVKYEDPKAFDHTALQTQKYAERSLEIGQEMFYVFSNIR